jgi:hypothetical protein
MLVASSLGGTSQISRRSGAGTAEWQSGLLEAFARGAGGGHWAAWDGGGGHFRPIAHTHPLFSCNANNLRRLISADEKDLKGAVAVSGVETEIQPWQWCTSRSSPVAPNSGKVSLFCTIQDDLTTSFPSTERCIPSCCPRLDYQKLPEAKAWHCRISGHRPMQEHIWHSPLPEPRVHLTPVRSRASLEVF